MKFKNYKLYEDGFGNMEQQATDGVSHLVKKQFDDNQQLIYDRLDTSLSVYNSTKKQGSREERDLRRRIAYLKSRLGQELDQNDSNLVTPDYVDYMSATEPEIANSNDTKALQSLLSNYENELSSMMNDAKLGTDVNVWFVGPAGCGKTEIVGQWFKDRSSQVLPLEVNTALIDALDVGGLRALVDADLTDDQIADIEKDIGLSKDQIVGDAKTRVKRKQIQNVHTSLFNQLIDTKQKTPFVLVMDEMNRGKASVLAALLGVVGSHRIYDPDAPGGNIPLPNLAFTVAMSNPNSYSGVATVADGALVNRFDIVEIQSDNKSAANYLNNLFNKKRQVINGELYLLNKQIERNEPVDKEEFDDLVDDYVMYTKMQCIAMSLLNMYNVDTQEAYPLFDNPNEIDTIFGGKSVKSVVGQGQVISSRNFTKALFASLGDPSRFWNQFKSNFGDYEAVRTLDKMQAIEKTLDKLAEKFSRGDLTPYYPSTVDVDVNIKSFESAATAVAMSQNYGEGVWKTKEDAPADTDIKQTVVGEMSNY